MLKKSIVITNYREISKSKYTLANILNCHWNAVMTINGCKLPTRNEGLWRI